MGASDVETHVTYICPDLAVKQEAQFMLSNLNPFNNQSLSDRASCEKDQKEQV